MKNIDINEERKLFEEAFGPMPANCTWTGEGYCATSYSAWNSHSYSMNFEAWLKRAELEASKHEVKLTLFAPNGDTLVCHGNELDMRTLQHILSYLNVKTK